ncbi:MAG: c-type cytochrome, partial [Planctomycetota bacterium]
MIVLLAGLAMAAAPPTWSGSVAAIVHKNCAGCHRPGEVGPFPLLTYEDAGKRAGFIAETCRSRRMPPWKAEPGHGSFFDERRLSESEINAITAWAAAGAPRGDAHAEPKPPEFHDGWQLGKPDMVLRMVEPFTIPAEGRD